MRRLWILIAFLVAAGVAPAQRHSVGQVDPSKPDGQMIQQLQKETDAAKRIALSDQFLTQFPKHEATAWVLEQLLVTYGLSNQPDKVLEVGAKLLAVDPADVEGALDTYKAAVAKKDATQIAKWGELAHGAAAKMIASPKPGADTDFAKQAVAYIEDSMYKAAIEADEKDRVEICEALLRTDPDKEYVVRAGAVVFPSYQAAGAGAKAVALAEKVVAIDPSNEDMLLALATNDVDKGRADRAVSFTGKIIDGMEKKAKPEGMTDAAWANRKNTLIGLAHYVRGKLYVKQERLAVADKELRLALPSTSGALKAEVFFLIGLANAKMNRAQDAVDNFKACAAIPSPYKVQAETNIKAIKAAAPYVR